MKINISFRGEAATVKSLSQSKCSLWSIAEGCNSWKVFIKCPMHNITQLSTLARWESKVSGQIRLLISPSAAILISHLERHQGLPKTQWSDATAYTYILSFLFHFSLVQSVIDYSVSTRHTAEEFLWRKLGALWSEEHCSLTHFLFLV